MMKEDPGVSNSQAWGCPCAPQYIFKETQASNLGDAPVHPFFINNHQFVPRSTIFLSLHALFCYVCCSNKSEPNLLFCVGEIHAPFELELLIGFACLFS